MKARILALLSIASSLALVSIGQTRRYGLFEEASDVGKALKGVVELTRDEYRVSGGGENMWADSDAFYFVWRKVSGDVTLAADVQFIGEGKVAHRKAVIIIRQSLDPRSAYVDAAVHGDGLTSLQYRPSAGDATKEIKAQNEWFGSPDLIPSVRAPKRIRLERHGNRFVMLAGVPGGKLATSEAATVTLQDPVYVGLAVCSHDAATLETAVFSNVRVERAASDREPVKSMISIFNLKDRSTEVVYTADRVFEAPNWSPDGKYLLVNSGGRLYRLHLETRQLEEVDLGTVSGVNNDHGISKDGKLYAVSAQGPPDRQSRVYVLSAAGKEAKLLTKNAPSYYHGWSPDGRWLAFAAFRGPNLDVYRIPVAGGEEERLTTHSGADDGPDYSPDGRWIYWNSDRTGNYDIWRMPQNGAGPDDSKAQQVTSDEMEDWFPHPSPDGKWLVFLSFEKGTQGHPANRNVVLRMIPMPGAELKPARIELLTKFFGGQGTINVNSWSPDSSRFAFVKYELLK